MAEEESPAGRFARWAGSWASVIAPASVISALLFYFGYVAARAQYAYFGIDVDMVELGTQNYIMRSPQPLLVPLLLFTLLGAAVLFVHTEFRRRVQAAAQTAHTDADTPERTQARRRLRRSARAVRAAVLVGLVALVLGIGLVFGYTALRNWPLFDLVTPLLLAIGGGMVAYAWRSTDLLRDAAEPAAARSKGRTASRATPPAADATLLRRAIRALLYLLTAVSVLWATATVAQWSGRGLARDVALHLDRLPRVILDTKERLFVYSPDIEETQLPTSDGQTFRFRYRHLRLLIMGHDRMFLVPEHWSASDTTLVVPVDGSVRIQFQFQNQPP
jgi:hypothetical protein